jgi:murein DD-endopeptidase MepM/ murein hydrolase activator NlpD
VKTVAGASVMTLVNGENFYIGSDNKAHFKNGGTLPPEQSAPGAQQPTQSVPSGAATQTSQHLIWPVDPHPITGRFNSSEGRSHAHRGIDIGVTSVEVTAVADGVVLSTGYTNPRGNYIYVNHGGSTQSVYEHLGEIFISQSDPVAQGQIIAISGKSGKLPSGGDYPPHLHFELLVNVPDSVTKARTGKEPPFTWSKGTTGYHVNPPDYLGK